MIMTTDQNAVKKNAGGGKYTVKTVADILGKSSNTVRRWMRMVDAPKPSHSIQMGSTPVQLWDDEDVQALRTWSEGLRPGPKPKAPLSEPRVPGKPFKRTRVKHTTGPSSKHAEKLPAKVPGHIQKKAIKAARAKAAPGAAKVVKKAPALAAGPRPKTVATPSRRPKERRIAR